MHDQFQLSLEHHHLLAAAKAECVRPSELEVIQNRSFAKGSLWPVPAAQTSNMTDRSHCVTDFGFVSNKRPFDEHYFLDRIRLGSVSNRLKPAVAFMEMPAR